MIDRRFPLSEVPAAVRYVEDGRARGKGVITVWQYGSEPGSHSEGASIIPIISELECLHFAQEREILSAFSIADGFSSANAEVFEPVRPKWHFVVTLPRATISGGLPFARTDIRRRRISLMSVPSGARVSPRISHARTG
jgi:hypothetical protein